MPISISPYVISSLLFIPYLPFGLRAEHVFVFLAVALFLFSRDFKLNRFVFLLSIFLLFSLVPLLLSSTYSFETGLYVSPFIMFARLAFPGVALICFSLILSGSPLAFTHSIRAIVFSASLLGAIAFISFLIPEYNYFLSPWVRSDEEGVWYQATSLDRVVGVFNQPLEAGLFYSVALLASIVQLRMVQKIGALNYFSLLLIVLGGVLTLSKVFLVLGILLGVLFATSLRLVSLRFYPIAFLLVIIVFSFLKSLAPAYFQSLFDLYDEGGFLFSLTAGRIGALSEKTYLYQRLFDDYNWIYGFGLGSQLPLDSGYLEYFYQGGVIALLGYFGFIFLLFFAYLNMKRSIQGKLILFLTVLLVFSSVGGPVLSAGRANIAFILLLAAALVSGNYRFEFKNAEARCKVSC